MKTFGRAAAAAILSTLALLLPGTAVAEVMTAPAHRIPDPRPSRSRGPPLPPGTLDSRDARIVYLYGEREIARANDTQRAIGVPAEVRSRVLFEMRNALRTYTESSCPTGSPHWVSRSPTPT